MKLKLVLNTDYGGFSATKEMVDWLKAKGWTIIPEKNYYSSEKKYPLTTIISGSGYNSFVHYYDIQLRSHPDLIECVRTLQKLHENDTWTEQRQNGIYDLSIVEVDISIEIEDYHDGKERVVINHYVDYTHE